MHYLNSLEPMASSIKSFDYNPSEGKHGVIMIIILKVLMIFSLPLSNPPKLSDITGCVKSIHSNRKWHHFTFNQTAIGQSIGLASSSGTTNILTGLATSTDTEIYVVTTKGRTYPIDNSSTISIRQDINTGYIYLDLNSSALSNYAPLNSPSFTGTVNTGALNVVKAQSMGNSCNYRHRLITKRSHLDLYRYADKRVSEYWRCLADWPAIMG
jgi:hypothetical protein